MGVDEQVLIDLQESWESKLQEQQPMPGPTDHFPGKVPRPDESSDALYPPMKRALYEFNSRSTIGLPNGQLPPLSTVINSANNHSDSNFAIKHADLQYSNGQLHTNGNRRGSGYSEIELDELLGPPTGNRRFNSNQLDGLNDEVQDMPLGVSGSFTNTKLLTNQTNNELTTQNGNQLSQPTTQNGNLLSQPTTQKQTPSQYSGSSFPTDNFSSSSLEELSSGSDDGSGASSGGEDGVVGNRTSDNVILCQYEKVTHIKNKWKCILRDGMLHIDNKDYAFHRATCDFEW